MLKVKKKKNHTVIIGLDPMICTIQKIEDSRVKPGNDTIVFENDKAQKIQYNLRNEAPFKYYKGNIFYNLLGIFLCTHGCFCKAGR